MSTFKHYGRVLAVAATLPVVMLANPAHSLEILLTNDDGYESSNLQVLRDALAAAGHTVYVSAPAGENSGKSSAMTTDSGSSLAYTEEVVGYEWSVGGTPVDSVAAGLTAFLPSVGIDVAATIDLVISGPNDGDNAGRVTNNSGTVGAAMHALRNAGVPSIALSVGKDYPNTLGGYQLLLDGDPSNDSTAYQLLAQASTNEAIGAQTAAHLMVQLIEHLSCVQSKLDADALLPAGIALNINVPPKAIADIKGVKKTIIGNSSIVSPAPELDGTDLKVNFDLNYTLIGAMTGSVPEEALDLKQEAEALAAGYITISPASGSYTNKGTPFKGRVYLKGFSL